MLLPLCSNNIYTLSPAQNLFPSAFICLRNTSLKYFPDIVSPSLSRGWLLYDCNVFRKQSQTIMTVYYVLVYHLYALSIILPMLLKCGTQPKNCRASVASAISAAGSPGLLAPIKISVSPYLTSI